MPTPVQRPSLVTTLDQRYAYQHAGGAFEVKDVLGGPGSGLVSKVIDATSLNGATFQSPNGFAAQVAQGVSQFVEVQTDGKNGGISRFAQNLDNQKYKP
jgi:hypothetical protein